MKKRNTFPAQEDAVTLFDPAYNAGLTPKSDLAILFGEVYGGDGRYTLTRRELLAHFGYEKLGSKNVEVIEQCLAERGVDVPTSWRTSDMNQTIGLTKNKAFFATDKVAQRLRAEVDSLVARTMRVKTKDVLLLCGYARKTASAQGAIDHVLRLGELEMVDGPSRASVYIRPAKAMKARPAGPERSRPEDRVTCGRSQAEKTADQRLRKYHPEGWLGSEQKELSVRFLEGRHAFGIMPTGSGKSLCFSLAAEILSKHGVTLVVSPLIALMADQNKDDRAGVTFFNSTLTEEEEDLRRSKLLKAKYFLVYVTPERLGSEVFLRTLIDAKKPVIRVAIDEAHCVSLWGHSFRPEYLLLRDVLRRLGSPPTLLLTATAPDDIRADIVKQLGLKLTLKSDVVHGFYRRNELSPGVQAVNGTADKYQVLKHFIQQRLRENPKARGIVFTQYATAGDGEDHRQNCEEIRGRLAQQHSVGVAIYHGQLSAEQKATEQARFTDGDAQILAATNAFGLGIDLPSIDWVVHFYMPPSILDYYQEIGRGGRKMNADEGDRCHCHVLYDPKDRRLAEHRVFGNLASADKIQLRFRQLLEGAKGHTGLRGPHDVLYDRTTKVLYLPFRPTQYTVRLGHLLVLQEVGIVKRLPENVYHNGTAYARFQVQRVALTPKDQERLKNLQGERRLRLKRQLDEMETFCQLPDEDARWDFLHDYFDH